MKYNRNTGGREKYFKGTAGDCGVRAAAIALDQDYMVTYNDLKEANKAYMDSHYDKISKQIRKNGTSPRDGLYREVMHEYMTSKGWIWVPTMKIGEGCRVHLRADELPTGRLICRVSRHYVAVIDGSLNDIFDASREGTRCVYGYWAQEPPAPKPKKERKRRGRKDGRINLLDFYK